MRVESTRKGPFTFRGVTVQPGGTVEVPEGWVEALMERSERGLFASGELRAVRAPAEAPKASAAPAPTPAAATLAPAPAEAPKAPAKGAKG